MKRYTVGIDLGTSNTVVAYVEHGGGEIRVFDVEQLVARGEVGAQPLLPSVRYHPAANELDPRDLQLPWQRALPPGRPGAPPAPPVLPASPAPIIGRFARLLGAQVPGRLVTSAKSWLSHASVDRLAPILPWGAPDDVAKVSPVEASASYLAHVRAAWNARFADAPLEAQDVVLTVPASFDEGARALTLEAARLAQLPALRLLEEPQAAFYDWLFEHRATLAQALGETRLVLICDVGGGTTDLTLIKVDIDATGEPQLTRIGVGNHLMLGGDNMDLALARLAETRLVRRASGDAAGSASHSAQANVRLSAAQLSQLVERCRVAKEQLLDANGPASVPITLLGAGSRVVGGALSTQLTRDEVEQVVVDGFFPQVAFDDMPRRSRAALIEFGLPYASDPAVTRHVAAFLARHAAPSHDALGEAVANRAGNAADQATGEASGQATRNTADQTPDNASAHTTRRAASFPVPDTLLLNGGVFHAQSLAGRLAATLGAWRGKPLNVLHNTHPDVAVARGAVAYALARDGNAPRIGGGSARSYFLALDDGQGICLLPRGTEEGREVRLEDREFALRLAEPVRFRLASTVADTPFSAGDLTDLSQGDFLRLPPVATVVQEKRGSDRRERRVRLTTSMTEVGTLEVTCVAIDDPSQRWLLPFELRRDEATHDHAQREANTPGHAAFDHALELIERAFGARVADIAPGEVKRLRARLEHTLGKPDEWDLVTLRKLFDALWARAKRRRRSADHERVWLNLAGFCLRPGFGDPLDEWRVEQLWTLFDDGIQYLREGQVWSEWWTLWRRVAGGLGEAAQLQLLEAMDFLQEANIRKQKLPFDPAKVGYRDMMRVQASLERVPVERKIVLAGRLMTEPRKAAEMAQIWWSVGRIGARLPFYGSAHAVVPPEVALSWLDAVLALDWNRTESAAFAAAQLARLTGDRSRDLPAEARERVLRRLETHNAAASWVRMVREVVTLDAADSGRVFGEALPAGLKLIGG